MKTLYWIKRLILILFEYLEDYRKLSGKDIDVLDEKLATYVRWLDKFLLMVRQNYESK